jgi:hypothetical protein
VREWIVELSGLLPIGTLVLGWGLNQIGSRRRAGLELHRKLYDLKVEAYAHWMSAMEVMMESWTSNSGPRRDPQLGVLRKKLDLLEGDVDTRRLVSELYDTLPIEGSKDYHWMHMASHSAPEFDWQPFRAKMNELIERVRSARP